MRGIDPLIGPELLAVLASMGHGDELVIADRNFPSRRVGARVVELRGADAPTAIEAICQLLPLDVTVDCPVARMETAGGPADIPDVHREVIDAVEPHLLPSQAVASVERFAFYDRAAQAFAVVVTGESRPYGDFILTKGVL